LKSAWINALHISRLFPRDSLLVDRNQDGYPDFINLKIHVSPLLTDPYVWTGLLNVTARLSFEVTALDLPVVREGLPSGSAMHGPRIVVLQPGQKARPILGAIASAEIRRKSNQTIYIGGSSGRAMASLLNQMAVGSDQNAFPLPENWRILKLYYGPSHRIEIIGPRGTSLLSFDWHAPNFSKESDQDRFRRTPLLDLLNLTGRSGLYRTSRREPRARELHTLVEIHRDKITPEVGLGLAEVVTRMVLEATEIRLPLVFMGEAPEAPVIIQVREGPGPGDEIRLLRKDAKHQVIVAQGQPRSLATALKNWFRWALTEGGPGSELVDNFRNDVERFQDLIAGQDDGVRWRRSRSLLPTPYLVDRPEVFRRHANWKTETSEILELTSQVPPGQGRLFGEIFVSKSQTKRTAIKAQLLKLLIRRGYQPELVVINAYKPGLSWLMESVLPRLEALKPISQLEISYQAFLPAARSLELRSRWLQELFPGPELVAKRLRVDSRRIKIRREKRLRSVYRVRAWNQMGDLIFESGLSPRWRELAYLSTRPRMGFVHPTTGGIRLWQSRRILLDTDVATDREKFWATLQDRWLPLLEKHMEERLETESTGEQAAFWKEIVMEVSIDESDTRLGFSEERICPMEALHEDIYFHLLEAYSDFARRNRLSPSIHLGKVIPKVSAYAKNGIPTASLRAETLPWPRAPLGNKRRNRNKRPVLTAMSFRDHYCKLELRDTRRRLRKTSVERVIGIAKAWGFRVERSGDRLFWLWLRPPRLESGRVGISRAHRLSKGPSLDRLLPAREVENWIGRLAQSPCLGVWELGETLEGRSIWAVEAMLKSDGQLTSTAKTRLLKPTVLFNARHHANEISSTNAALRMAWTVASTKKGQEMLRHLILAWIPMENADGGATLERLLPLGQDHMLHAARYNALGVEYYTDYFERNPRFPEARAKVRLWSRWLPEIMVDHHGVPSHEWNQPFSGYVPFHFREFWIPRTFVYAHVPFVEDPTHPGHRSAVRLARLMGRVMMKEKKIIRLNRQMAMIYRRYAHGPEPDMFPASRGEQALVLPLLKRTYRTNFAVRFPHITRSEIIVEVPDEVASGRLLELCVRAHLKIEEGLFRAVRRSKGRVDASLERETGLLHLRWVPGRLILRDCR
jgi:hypothetical protein